MKTLILILFACSAFAQDAPLSKEDIAATVRHLQALAKEQARELDDAKLELNSTKAQLTEAGASLLDGLKQTIALQQQIDALTKWGVAQQARADVAEAADAKDKAEARHQTGLAWKWRLISLGIVLLVAGFFVARQYFPFLKLL